MSREKDQFMEEIDEIIVERPCVDEKAELVQHKPSSEVKGALEDYAKKVREAIMVHPDDWPKGRTVKFTIKFTVFPSSITTEFGQE